MLAKEATQTDPFGYGNGYPLSQFSQTNTEKLYSIVTIQPWQNKGTAYRHNNREFNWMDLWLEIGNMVIDYVLDGDNSDIYGWMWTEALTFERRCCVHNVSTVPWTSAGQFGRPRGVRGRPWYDLWRPRCVISHPMDVRGLPPGRPPSGRPRDTQFGIDWSLLPSGCPQGVRTAEVQPITARTHYGQEVGLPTVRPKPEVDVP